MESTKSHGKWEVAEIQISYKPNVKPSERPRITGARDAYEILKASWDGDKLQLLEQFKILLLNLANKVMGVFLVSTGGIVGTSSRPKVDFCNSTQSRGLRNHSCS